MKKSQIIRLGCGLDISKANFHTCVGLYTDEGRFVIKASRRFDNTSQGIKSYLAWLNKWHDKLNEDLDRPFQVVMEVTGVYHEQVCHALYQAGFKVCVELANRVKKYLHSIGQTSKTDKLDARGICQMACERQLKSWQPFSQQILAIRALLRYRKSLLDQRNRLSNQLHAIEHSAFKELSLVRSLQGLIKRLTKEVEKIESKLKELYQQDEQLQQRLDPIIESLPGVGFITALTVVAETNGFAHITSAKQLASYSGYDIIENQSGNSSKPSRISKKGNVRIRQVMYMAAVSCIRTEKGSLYDFYQRIRQRNPKVYKIANVAVQRKLLLLIYTLFKNQTSYDPNYDQTKNKVAPNQHLELHEIATD